MTVHMTVHHTLHTVSQAACACSHRCFLGYQPLLFSARVLCLGLPIQCPHALGYVWPLQEQTLRSHMSANFFLGGFNRIRSAQVEVSKVARCLATLEPG